MYAWAASTLWELANPAIVIPGALLVGVALLWTPWRRPGRWLATVAALAFLAIAALPVPAWLLRPLEDRFSIPAVLPDRIDGVIVLGGSVSLGVTQERGQPALNANGERLVEFAAFARRFPDAVLVFTGGGKNLQRGLPTEASVSLDLLARMGLDPARIVVEDRSTDTYGNAVLTKALVQPVAGQNWILLTSAWHMPRAVGAFRAAGWTVIPFPVDYTTGGPPALGFDFDPVTHLPAISQAVHEWIGLVMYRLLGRSNELFPAP